MSARNLAEQLRCQAEQRGPAVALRYKRYGYYRDLSWDQYHEIGCACAAALIDAGLQKGDRAGIFAENRLEWLLADVGILTAAAVNVTPHAPLTAKQVQYELADSGVNWLFVSTVEQRDKIAAIRHELPELRGVVVFDSAAVAPGFLSWQGFLQRGRMRRRDYETELRARETALSRDDLATIMYTSGTTGQPKGVMLTHGNLLSNTQAMLEASPQSQDDMCLNWLPFSHIYARTVDHYRTLVSGSPLALAENAECLVTNISDIHPTHMNSVPRFYEKVLTLVKSDDPAETGRRLRKVFGPRIAFLSSGGAPLPLPVAQAYQAAGLLILQGYGLTETSPVITFNRRERFKLDSVGPAINGVEVRIGDDGEVLTRGPHVMKGYWKKPGATTDAIRDNWFHTGDLGRLDNDGFLYITGRKKELMVLSNGKKVVPSYLEGLLIADACIDQAVVCGEGRNFLTALIVPHWDNLRAALNDNTLAKASASELAQHPAVHALLEKKINATLAEVSSYEQVRKFAILTEPFSQANDELTVTLKLRRSVVVNHHTAALEKLYQGGRCE